MINPTTHAVSLFTIPTASADPREITAGPDGNIWFTEWANAIGMINPTTHAISSIRRPPERFQRPTLEITSGPDGNLWFTERSITRSV